MSEEKDGVYCKVCGGIIPQGSAIGSIEIEGKSTGINQLEFILDEVTALHLQSDRNIMNELVKRAKVLNYIPTKMTEKYAEALLQAFKKRKTTE
nr:NAC family transcription factor [uncultured Methanospirillum sp.]